MAFDPTNLLGKSSSCMDGVVWHRNISVQLGVEDKYTQDIHNCTHCHNYLHSNWGCVEREYFCNLRPPLMLLFELTKPSVWKHLSPQVPPPVSARRRFRGWVSPPVRVYSLYVCSCPCPRTRAMSSCALFVESRQEYVACHDCHLCVCTTRSGGLSPDPDFHVEHATSTRTDVVEEGS